MTATPADENADLPQITQVVAAAECSFSFVAAPEIEKLELGLARDRSRMFEDPRR